MAVLCSETDPLTPMIVSRRYSRLVSTARSRQAASASEEFGQVGLQMGEEERSSSPSLFDIRFFTVFSSRLPPLRRQAPVRPGGRGKREGRFDNTDHGAPVMRLPLRQF